MGFEEERASLLPDGTAINEVPHSRGKTEETRLDELDGDSIDESKTSGIAGSSFNLANAVLGGGILSFPYAYMEAGLVGGVIATIILLFFAYGALISIVMTADIYAKNKVRSYQNLVGLVYGPGTELFMIISIAIFGFGACVTFLVIIGDQFTPVMEVFAPDTWFSDRRVLITAVGLVFVFPLTCLKRISLLGYSSFLAIIMVYYFTLMVIAFSLFGVIDSNGDTTLPLVGSASTIFQETTWWNVSVEFFQCAPIICFAFQCHMSAVPIYRELSHRTPKRMAVVSAAGLLNCMVLYIAAGVTGYWTFLSETQSDVLKNYDENNDWVVLCRVGMGLVAGFSFPLINFVTRLACNDFYLRVRSAVGSPVDPRYHDVASTNVRFFTLTTLLFVAGLMIALFVPTVNAVISLIGSIFATLFIFGFPGAFFVSIAKFQAPSKQLYFKLLGAFYIIVGFFVGSISLLVSLGNDIEVVLNSDGSS